MLSVSYEPRSVREKIVRLQQSESFLVRWVKPCFGVECAVECVALQPVTSTGVLTLKFDNRRPEHHLQEF